jgi:hypothetical protein
MTHRRKLLLGLLFLGLVVVAGAGWWWYTRPFKIILGGCRGSSDNLSVSCGHRVVVGPKPGVLFGTVRKPGRQEEFTYVILVRHGRPSSDGSNQGSRVYCTSDGSKAETKDEIELEGKRIEAAYRIELNQTRTAVATESLAIGGKSVDITSGQVFLIDLTAETPADQQKKVELPVIPSQWESPQDIEQLAEAIRKSLESQDSEIKAFLR